MLRFGRGIDMKTFQTILLAIGMFILFLATLVGLYFFAPGVSDTVNGMMGKAPAKKTKAGISADSVSSDELSEVSANTSVSENYGLAEDVVSEYIPPEESALDVPDALKELTGYEPVRDEIEILKEDEADRIEKELPTGPTGDDLEFDPLFYPYYAMIDDTSKHIYRQIYANALELNPSFLAAEKNISQAQLKNAFVGVFNDHPELFWLNTEYRAYYRDNGDFIELDLSFNQAASDPGSAKSAFEDAAAGILKDAASAADDYEKEKLVHGAIAELDSYSLSAPMNQSAYSALVNGETVCAGYSRSFQYLMQQLGIPCYYCYGYAGENHAWNIICLDGDFYNVDVTWDDTGSSGGYNYSWFNKTDEDYGTTHIRRELARYLPACSGEKYRDLEPDTEVMPESRGADAGILYEYPGVGRPKYYDAEGNPTPESYGLSPDDVLSGPDAYYSDCLDQIKKMGKGSYRFYNMIYETDLEGLNAAYNTGAVREYVLAPALEDLGGSSANIRMYPVRLTDGLCLIENTVTIR